MHYVNTLPLGTSGRKARDVATRAAKTAGAILRERFGKARTVGHKGRGNIVTEADLLSERAVLAALRLEFPDHGILSEESPAIESDSGYTWIVDPLDGTMNFSLGVPFFAVSIALARYADPVLGVIYDPLRRELLVAERGRGATLNGRPIRTNDKPDLTSATIGLDFGYDEAGKQRTMLAASTVRPAAQTLRVVGSAVLGQAYVACGRFDLYFHNYVYPWDVAAGQVALLEAGAVVTDFGGVPTTVESRTLVAANPILSQHFRDFVARGVPAAK